VGGAILKGYFAAFILLPAPSRSKSAALRLTCFQDKRPARNSGLLSEGKLHGFDHFLFELGERKLKLAGHGGYGLEEGRAFGLNNKVRHDEVGGGEAGFAHNLTQNGSAAQAAATMEAVYGVILMCRARFNGRRYALQ